MDIVIPFHPKDTNTVQKCVISCRVFVQNCRHIYLVCREDPRIANTIWVPESSFPFSYDDVGTTGCRTDRIGWYLQQLLKLHVDDVLGAALSENFLIVDSDVVFRRPVTFLDGAGDAAVPLYAWGSEAYAPYFVTLDKLIPGLTKQLSDKSGICHHMVFNKRLLGELKREIRGSAADPVWKIVMAAVDKTELSGFSEYETYFNYVVKYHPDKIRLRQMKWKDAAGESPADKEFDYVAYHSWMRR